jgi:hypothetical protein
MNLIFWIKQGVMWNCKPVHICIFGIICETTCLLIQQSRSIFLLSMFKVEGNI